MSNWKVDLDQVWKSDADDSWDIGVQDQLFGVSPSGLLWEHEHLLCRVVNTELQV
jgi:hypothetical protein